MARRIRWQILIAVVSSVLVLGLMSYLALTTAAVAQPLAGGVYVEYETSHPQQLNPLLSAPAQDPVAADLRSLIFNGLMRIGDDGLPQPDLLQRWPDIDESGTIFTFTLRSGVRWHDGEQLTTNDVLFTLRAIQSPGFVGDPQTGAIWKNVLLERIDDQQFRATLPGPLASFLSYATFPILPAHVLENVPPEQWASTAYNQQPIGTGPYRLSAPVNSEHALLAANNNYYNGSPYLNSIEIRFDQTAQDAYAALNQGQNVGIAVNSLSDTSRASTPRNASRYVTPIATYTTLTFNTRNELLSDQVLRRALALGTDKDTLITQTLGGRAARVDTPILPGSWAYDPQAAAYRYNRDEAAEALDSLGYTVGPDGSRTRNGTPLQLALLTDSSSEHTAVAKEIANQWSALGIQVQIETVELDALENRLNAHQFTVALHSWQRQGPDPDVVYAQWHSSNAESGFNYSGLQDPELDSQLDLAHESQNMADRVAAYAVFQRQWLDLVPGITLYQPQQYYTTSSIIGGLQATTLTTNDESPSMNTLLTGREDRFVNVVRWYLLSGREIRGDLRQNR